MECSRCKATFDAPLELFDGTLRCPHCKRELEMSDRLCATPESEESFLLGDMQYKKSLVEKNVSARKRLVEQARLNIRSAAGAGHPKALLRLGHMYATGFIPASEKVAVKMAEKYYKKVWDGDYGAQSAEKYRPLIPAAAARHIELLVRYGRRDDLVALRREMNKRPALAGADLPIPQEIAEAADDGKGRLTYLLDDCLSGGKIPLFGLVELSGRDFVEWARTLVNEKGKKITNIEKYTSSGIVIKYILARSDVNAVDSDVAKDIAAHSPLAESLVKESALYVYFYNYGGDRKCRKYRGLQRLLDGNYSEKILSILGYANAVTRDIVIREDDIVAFRSRFEPLGHALGDLMKYMTKNNVK